MRSCLEYKFFANYAFLKSSEDEIPKIHSLWWPIALACALLAACVSMAPRANPDYDANKPHHRPDGFANRYSERSDKPGLLRWQWERLRDGLPKPPAKPIMGIEPNLELINSDSSQPRVTWVGHSTLLVQIDGLNLLTDPHWGQRASPFSFAGPKRHQAPGIPFDKLPKIDAVVISHNHWDHLDQETVQALMTRHSGIRFFVPLGISIGSRKKSKAPFWKAPRATSLRWIGINTPASRAKQKTSSCTFWQFSTGVHGQLAIATKHSGAVGPSCIPIFDSGFLATWRTRVIPKTSVSEWVALTWRPLQLAHMNRAGS
jgi:hypothetical protein